MQNLLDPAILFFALGVFAGALRSNLEIPPAIARFLSLYLLMALGLKGGFALARAGLDGQALQSLGAAVLLAVAVPAMGYALLRRHTSGFNAAAIAASYGSVSAVTFVTALQYMDTQGLAYSGHMPASLVLMESPAIVMAVVLANRLRAAQPGAPGVPAQATRTGLRHALRDSLTDGANLLLLGALAIGWISGEAGKTAMQPFSGDLFKGMLAFFLLDMGLGVARNFQQARRASPLLLAYALLAPMVHASLAMLLALLIGMPVADAALLMILAASASYIAVPAVLRYAIPEASPSLYLGLSLGVTFPVNILVGIPAYTHLAQRIIG